MLVLVVVLALGTVLAVPSFVTARVAPHHAAGTASPPPVPVLGDAAAGVVGFGKVLPVTVAPGIVVTTQVWHVHWRHWGAGQATGTGTGFWVPAGRPFSDARSAPADIVAFDLGTCHGQRAYRKVESWLPSRGGRFNPRNAYPACL